MINEIKTIVENYLKNAKLTRFIIGTVVNDGIKISDKLIVPNELIQGNLKNNIIIGQKVRLLQNYGGQEFYITEIIDSPLIMKGTVLEEVVEIDEGFTIPKELIVGDLKNNLEIGDRISLIRNNGKQEFYILEVVR